MVVVIIIVFVCCRHCYCYLTSQQIEGLAIEKQALEKMLQQEKQTMTTEKENLADQLRTALSQLHETQQLLSKEEAMKTQLESEMLVLDGEKQEILRNYNNRVDDVVQLKNDILNLQANHEKDKVLIESLESMNKEQEKVIVCMNIAIEEELSKQVIWESEKEEFIQ